jgi:protein XagA
MKKATKISAISTLILFLIFSGDPSVLNAQAWTKAKGSGFYKLDYSYIGATRIFDTKREVVPFPSSSNSIASFYGEYGVSDKFTIIGYVPFLVLNASEALKNTAGVQLRGPVSNSNFGDVDLGFRYQLYNKNGYSVSANLFLGLPTGNSKQANDFNSGDGEFNQMLKIGVGTGKKQWWAQGAVGFNNRTNNYSDEFRYDIEVGYKLFNERLLTMFKINGIESLNNGTAKENAVGLFSNNVEFSGFGPEFLYYFNDKKKMGISFRAAGSFKGRNVLAGPSFSGGFFTTF